MERQFNDMPSGFYRFEKTPRGRIPLARSQAARRQGIELSKVGRQLLWSLPLAVLAALVIVGLRLLPGAVENAVTVQLAAIVGVVPAVFHLSRWSRLRRDWSAIPTGDVTV